MNTETTTRAALTCCPTNLGDALAAALVHSSKETHKPALWGMLLDMANDGTATATATDGYTLARVMFPASGNVTGTESHPGLFLDRDTATAIQKTAKGYAKEFRRYNGVEIALTVTATGWELVATINGAEHARTAGAAPDTASLHRAAYASILDADIPEHLPGCRFTAETFQKLAKTADLIGQAADLPTLLLDTVNPTKPARFSMSGANLSALVIAMPCRA